MEEHIRDDILNVLKNTVRALHREDIKGLKSLSDMTVHNASIHQDQYSISVSVLIYSLAKLYERERYEQFKSWVVLSGSTIDRLQSAIRFLEVRDYPAFDKVIQNFLAELNRVEKGLRKYIQDVLQKAKISKASRLHEHGLSLGRTAQLLGISQYELMEYVGKTYIADMNGSGAVSEKNRLKYARSLF